MRYKGDEDENGLEKEGNKKGREKEGKDGINEVGGKRVRGKIQKMNRVG